MTDIKALIERLRYWADELKVVDIGKAAAALEALQAENMDLRGLLAETVPDPEYRKMQDDEIERLRQERKAMLTRVEKAADALEALQSESAARRVLRERKP
jgi:hypothetical protein